MKSLKGGGPAFRSSGGSKKVFRRTKQKTCRILPRRTANSRAARVGTKEKVDETKKKKTKKKKEEEKKKKKQKQKEAERNKRKKKDEKRTTMDATSSGAVTTLDADKGKDSVTDKYTLYDHPGLHGGLWLADYGPIEDNFEQRYMDGPGYRKSGTRWALARSHPGQGKPSKLEVLSLWLDTEGFGHEDKMMLRESPCPGYWTPIGDFDGDAYWVSKTKPPWVFMGGSKPRAEDIRGLRIHIERF
jgi:hypothetical protein